jgi:methyl acetate hydrolase
MATNQIGALTVGAMASVLPERSNHAEFFPGMVKRWGLGFLITTEDAPSGRAAGSLTWAGLANCYYWIDPKRQVAGVLLTQILPFVEPPVMQLYARFERILYDALGMP